MSVNLKSVIVCDDVRVEASGKEILIGVYSGGLNFNPPSPGRISQILFRIEIEMIEETSTSGTFSIISPTNVLITTNDFEINLPDNQDLERKLAVFVLAHNDLIFYESGLYTLKTTLSGEEFEDKLNITFLSAPPVTSPTS